MAQAPAIADRSRDVVFALGGQFPDLDASAIELFAEPDADLLRAEWDGWTAIFPESEAGLSQLTSMSAVMPHLRGFVSPAVPIWERAHESGDWQRDWRAAPQAAGRPLRPELIVEQNRERLIRDLAGFCHELHAFSIERARSLGVPSFHQWREEHEALARRSLAILRPLLNWSQISWARRWWSRFLEDDAVWRIQPSLVHGSISVDRLMVDPLVQQLAAVTGWHGMRVADPAVDFARLVDAYGTELGWRVVEHYGELGSTADAALFRRIRLQQTAGRFRGVVETARRAGVESEAMSDAVGRLRAATS